MQSLKADWQQDEAGAWYKQDEMGVRLYRTRNVESLIPLGQFFKTELHKKYRDARLDNFLTKYDPKLEQAKKFATGYVNRFKDIRGEGKGYYLYSKKPGSGKSFLACCILNGLSKQELTTQAITSIDFLKRLKFTFSDEDLSEEGVINPMLAVDVLLLDDIGSEKHSEWVDEQLYHIIDSRLNAGKPTFFTSNYSIDQLLYDDRIKSRINSVTAQIAMPEVDIRNLVTREQEKEFLGKML